MFRRSLPWTLTLALMVAGCVLPSQKTGVKPTSEGTIASPTKIAPTVTLTGLVTAPAGVVSAGGANVVSPGGGNVISPGGGNVVSPGGGNYRTLAAPAESPLVDTEVFVADAAGNPVKNLPRVRTDAQGRYRLPSVPTGFTFKVVAAAKTADGKAVALQSIIKPAAGATACDVGAVTTLVTETVSEGKTGMLGQFDAAAFTEAVADAKANLSADDLPTDWSDREAIRATFRKLAQRIDKLQKTVDALQAELAKQAASQADLDAAVSKASAPPSAAPSRAPSTPPAESVAPKPALSTAPSAAPTPEGTPTPMRVTKVLDGATGAIGQPKNLVVNGGTLWVADQTGDRVVVVNLTDGTSSNLAPARTGGFQAATGVARDAAGNIFVAGRGGKDRIYKVTPAGVDSTFSGSTSGYVNGAVADARYTNLSAIDFDDAGNLYVADSGNNCIRKITTDGQVITLAGSTTAGYSDGKGSEARFNGPKGLAVTPKGLVWVADTGNHAIRRIGTDGTVTTLTGNATVGAEDGAIAEATFNQPSGITPLAGAFLLVADTGNGRLRRINLDTGTVETVKTAKAIGAPFGLAHDVAGRIYVSDGVANAVYRLDP